MHAVKCGARCTGKALLLTDQKRFTLHSDVLHGGNALVMQWEKWSTSCPQDLKPPLGKVEIGKVTNNTCKNLQFHQRANCFVFFFFYLKVNFSHISIWVITDVHNKKQSKTLNICRGWKFFHITFAWIELLKDLYIWICKSLLYFNTVFPNVFFPSLLFDMYLCSRDAKCSILINLTMVKNPSKNSWLQIQIDSKS